MDIRSVTRWRPGLLAANALRTTGWTYFRLALQTGGLIAIARWFGAEGYGVIAGVIALFTTLGQLVGLGSGIALVSSVSRDREQLALWLIPTLQVYFLSGVCLAAAAVALSAATFSQLLPLTALVALAVSEVLLAPLLQPFVYAAQATEKMHTFGAIATAASVARIAAIALTIILEIHGLEQFSYLYLSSMAICTGGTILLARLTGLAEVKRGTSHSKKEIIQRGYPYLLGGAASVASSEIDKPLLLAFTSATSVGQYTAAFRVAQAATIPIGSLLVAATSKLFRLNNEGAPSTFSPYIKICVGYGLVSSFLLVVLAPALPAVFGIDFQGAVAILQVMSIYLLTNPLRQFLAARLTTTDRQNTRNFVEIVAFIASTLVLLLAVPAYAIWAAVIALIINDSIVITACLLVLKKREVIVRRVR